MAGRRSLALIALLGCVLTGCSDAASDDPAPTPTESPTSSERDVIISVPTLPPAARKDTLKGAEAFIRHYIELLNYAANTGDVRRLITSATDTCGGCRDYARAYRDTYDAGGFVKTSGWRPTSVLATRVRDYMVVLVDVRAPDIIYSRRTGDPKKRGKGGIYKLRFEATNVRDGWKIRELTEQQGV